MRQLFISYARENKAEVEKLVGDLAALGHQVWVDSLRRGGQTWWDEILRRIADSDVFVAVVSGHTLSSVACRRELEWALALNKPVLPIAAERPSGVLLPPDLFVSLRHVVDYSQRTPETAFALAAALANLPSAPPVPDPLPKPPPAPLSYLSDLVDQVAQPEPLTHEQQRQVLIQLEPALHSVDAEERRGGRYVLEMFGKRDDLYADVFRTIEALTRADRPVGSPAPADWTVEEPAPAHRPVEEPAPADWTVEESAPADWTVEEPAPADWTVDSPAPADWTVEESAPADWTVEESAPADEASPAPAHWPVEEPARADWPVEGPAPADRTLGLPAPADTVAATQSRRRRPLPRLPLPRLPGSRRTAAIRRSGIEERLQEARGDAKAQVARPATRTGAPKRDESAEDFVDCSVFAPPVMSPGSTALVQVFVHLPKQLSAAARLARQFDPRAKHRGVHTLEVPIGRGDVLTLQLTIDGVEVIDQVQPLIWVGRPSVVQFKAVVPANLPTGQFTHGTLSVSRLGIPIGSVTFSIGIETDAAGTLHELVGDTAKRYTRAFVSYASEDRAAVLARVQILRAANIDYFQDIDMAPGERWEKELYRQIDRCDLFLLFWSQSAKDSEWVRREAQYALGLGKRAPDIKPVPIEGPPVPRPWDELAHLHADDRLLALQAVAARTN
jgi:hypothetical protein